MFGDLLKDQEIKLDCFSYNGIVHTVKINEPELHVAPLLLCIPLEDIFPAIS